MKSSKTITMQGILSFGLLLGSITLTSCSYFSHQQVSKLNSQKKMCQELKQQLIFPSTNNGPNTFSGTPTQQARVFKAYNHYNCQNLMGN